MTDTISQIGTAWYLGARFDLAFSSLKEGNFRPDPKKVKDAAQATATAVSSMVESARDEL